MDEHGRLAIDPHREWGHVLQAYAAALDEHQSVFATLQPGGMTDARAVMPPRFVPPAGIGPIPAALRDRAVALLAQTDGLVELAAGISSGLADSTPTAPAVRASWGSAGTSTMEQRL